MKAEDCARKALAIDPGRSSAYLILVRTIAAGERWAELAELLVRSERSLPDNLVPHYERLKG